MRAILGRGEYTDVLPHIRIPTVFAVGEDDVLTPPDVARRMACEVPGANVQVIPGAGHTVHHDAPDAFNAEVSAFLGQLR